MNEAALFGKSLTMLPVGTVSCPAAVVNSAYDLETVTDTHLWTKSSSKKIRKPRNINFSASTTQSVTGLHLRLRTRKVLSPSTKPSVSVGPSPTTEARPSDSSEEKLQNTSPDSESERSRQSPQPCRAAGRLDWSPYLYLQLPFTSSLDDISLSDFPLPQLPVTPNFAEVAIEKRPHEESAASSLDRPRIDSLAPLSPSLITANPISGPQDERIASALTTTFLDRPGNMARREPSKSRTSTLDSTTSAPSPSQLGFRNGINGYHPNMDNNASSTSLSRMSQDPEPNSAASRTPGSVASGGPSPAVGQTAGVGSTTNSTSGLSGLVCNVHRTTGREPHPLVGATTTVLGDKLYVFGGRRLSRTKPQLTSDLYELDLIKRHWTKLDVKGDIPPPRYFHSVCPLGDKKLVCYGGMSPARPPPGQSTQPQSAQEQPEVVVMSDIHIYDVPSRTWTNIQSPDSPQGRYAHCAAILPSSAIFTSNSATTSAIQHNPSSSNPNQGKIGADIDGTGGAEMIVVGGQDSGNHYIEEISIFNLRNLKWQPSNRLGKACGAYRSVVAPLTTLSADDVGSQANERQNPDRRSANQSQGASSMLIYSNYNFLDVKLELQIRDPVGNLQEKQMDGSPSPPGLRFPNGGVINNHFVVSGTFLTSSKQEYALWALDLRNMTWSKIDAGGNIFTQGSWNRGVLWSRRNTFVILGNRKRSLVDDYNHRRINFSNVCMVELEAFGLYENPRKTSPLSRYQSVSAPLQTAKLDHNAGGRQLSAAAEDLGHLAMGLRELNDMEIITIDNDRIPINSHIAARRWGPYFNTLLREGTLTAENAENADTATLRPSGLSTHPSRNSSITITPSVKTTYSSATTLTNNTQSEPSGPPPWALPDLRSGSPAVARSRTLYLPHTKLTIQALVHFLYTSALPPPSSPLCTPQILCSLLQIARPYQVDGLLESIIERQHAVLDGRNTAAIFNAAAMAAGGGAGVAFTSTPSQVLSQGEALSASALRELDEDVELDLELRDELNASAANTAANSAMGTTPTAQGLARLNTDLRRPGDGNRSEDELSSASTSTSTSELSSDFSGLGTEREIWAGELSAVVGLQKRGLRGLMEGRRMREMRGGSASGPDATGRSGSASDAMGLGISAEQQQAQQQAQGQQQQR